MNVIIGLVILFLLLLLPVATTAQELTTWSMNQYGHCDGQFRTFAWDVSGAPGGYIKIHQIRVHRLMDAMPDGSPVRADFSYNVWDADGRWLAGDVWDHYAHPTGPHSDVTTVPAGTWLRARGTVRGAWYCATGMNPQASAVLEVIVRYTTADQ